MEILCCAYQPNPIDSSNPQIESSNNNSSAAELMPRAISFVIASA